MLQFVLGRAGSGKTEYLRELLSTLEPAEKVMMLVPEQYTFETEKAVLRRAGPVRANTVQVYSFTRLAEAIFREEGGEAGRRLTDSGRRILMSEAVAACADHLEVYASAAKSNRLTDLMLSAVNEMKLCGIEPEILSETAGRLSQKGLSQKLRELGLIYGAYEGLVQASYLDPRDDLTRLEKVLETSSFFDRRTVLVDSFEGFTMQELRVLRRILCKAEQVVVALCTDGLPDDGCGLFTLVNRTYRRLSVLAQENGVPRRPSIRLESGVRFQNDALKRLEAQLFCPESDGAQAEGEAPPCIQVFEAADPYEEAEFVAASIRRLVMEQGYRYRDFSVICRSPERYYNCLSVALQKREVPCFVSAPARVDAEPVMRFLLGAFEAVQSGYGTEQLLGMLKTGVSGFTSLEISELENYAFLWKLSGAAWKEEFVRHPGGFSPEWTEEDRESLQRLRSLRERLMLPLQRFASRTRDASGREITEAAYRLLTDYGMEAVLPAYCRALEENGEQALAQKQVRVWELLCGILDQLHSLLGERKVSRERYYKLLKEVIGGEDVSEIPHTADEVIFGTAEQVRQSSPKVAFLLGAAQGEFPLTPKASGVFSDAERRELIALELPLGDPLEQKTMEERYLAYSVACAPSQRLIATYPRTAGGEDKQRSELIEEMLRIFPGITVEKNLPDGFFANSREAAFSRMAARFGEDSAEAAALRALFSGDMAYAGRLEALRRASNRTPERIGDRALAGRFFGETPFLSATQIETFYSCRFRYFCRYGLNVKERRPAEVDVMQYGTLMHFLFEKIFGESPRQERSPEVLEGYVEGLIEAYAEENMGGIALLSARETYRLRRMGQSACKLIAHVEEELRQSQFVPSHFELTLGDTPDYPPLRVRAETGQTVLVGGTIDRIDSYVRPSGEKFVRVVDYKTGKKEFKLSDVLYGLNMQMLIYLAALTENGVQLPAGVLYMPAAEPSVSAAQGMSEEKIRQEADKQLRMSGVVLDDTQILLAMENLAKGKFIPASLTKDGTLSKTSSTLNEKQLQTVLLYTKRLIATMARELAQGSVEAKPNLQNHNACRFCPYGAVCGKEFGEKDVEKSRLASGEVLALMERETEGGGENAAYDMDTKPI